MKKYTKLITAFLVVGMLAACSSQDSKSNTSHRQTDNTLSEFDQAMQIVDNQADGIIVIAVST